ncbi:MAG TPA: ImmA/IrrE family metallo-endopeptidase [bacterium]|nr:ImmA/IrrE family metallo-endopeptidase [bacterium]
MRIKVAPKILSWARQRAGLEIDALLKTFPKIREWEQGTARPTLKQLEAYARKTYLPVGVFFLPEPPQEELPIPDFRIMGGKSQRLPSPDLLDTIYMCQQRQEWYRDFARVHKHQQFDFIGSKTVTDDIIHTAKEIINTIHFNLDQRQQLRTWTDAFRLFVEKVEEQGIMVMISGVVGSNNYRKLDPKEFRGFVLVDNLAPLIFINAKDTISAKIFTLAHELVHLWLGESGVSDMLMDRIPDKETERWCNQIAAEMLVPLESISAEYGANRDLLQEIQRLAQHYKVSTLVVLRRILDMGAISEEIFWNTWNEEFDRLIKLESRSGNGGDFYRTLGVRISKRFARALVISTLEGQTLFRDAYRMLGIKKNSTFNEIAHQFGL